MGERKESREKTKYVICFVVLWILQMTAAFWFCTRKQGFHEDEFYTYYSTARTNGFYVEDGAWMERDAYRDEFVVRPEERFRYGLVKQVQSWDVHPPMYYWVFHTVASLTPDVFSKWTGLSVNLFFHGINLILLTYLSRLTAGRDKYLPLLVTFLYGFSPAAMSGVVFIRMYEMLTTFVLLCAVLHVRAVQRLQGSLWQRGSRISFGTLFAMAAVTYVGFLTQYYYFIFLFFLAVSFCVWLLWRDRGIGNCLRYGVFQGFAFVLAYLTYPAFPGQMFKGQRGAQATENFFHLSNTFERLRFFWDLMNRYVFGGLLGLTLLFLAAAAFAGCMGKLSKRRRAHAQAAENAGSRQRGERPGSGRAPFYMLLFTVSGYFLAVSKTALLLGDTSNRYQLPVYGIAALLLLLGASFLPGLLSGAGEASGDGGPFSAFAVGNGKRMACVAAFFCVAVVGMSYVRADVVFLYPESGEAVALARERAAAQTPAVYIYKPGEEWCIWAVADELMEYDRVYFVSAAGGEPVTEPAIAEADAVVVYLPLYDDAEEEAAQRMRVLSGNGKLSEGYLQFSHKYCTEWYYCGDGGVR